MKKLFYIPALVCAFALVSCAPSEVEDIFDENPAARLDNAVKNYTELLKSDGGRWLMQYFANPDEEGYNFVMTFHNDGSVDISTQNSVVNGGAFITDKSTWDVVSDYGPVLSFNTYNKAFHVFSSPQSDGTGHGGDYEFIILSADNDRINLRAKKSRSKDAVIDVVMTRLSSTEYPTDEDYFTQLTSVRRNAFSDRISNYVLTYSDGTRYICNDVATMLWSFYPETGTLLDNGEYMNAITTTKGLRFMQPLEFLTENEANQEHVVKIQNFEFQPDGSLLCTDDGATRITGPALADLFHQRLIRWRLSNTEGQVGGQFVDLFNAISAEANVNFKTSKWKNPRLDFIQLCYDSAKAKYGLYFSFGGTGGSSTGYIYLDNQVVDANTVKFTFNPDPDVAFDKNTQGKYGNGQIYYEKLPSIATYINMLCASEFTFTSDNVMVPNPMTMTSKSNSNDFVVLSF